MNERPAPPRLLLIRHAQTPGNAEGRFRGQDTAGEPLSTLGQAQARALAARLARREWGRVRLYSSPYLRTQQTAAPLGKALGVPVVTLPGVHEIGTGNWQGRPYSEMLSHANELVAPDGQFGFSGGESFVQVARRFWRALAPELPGPGETVMVVTHGAAIVAALSGLLGYDPRAAWADTPGLRHENTAVSELIQVGEEWQALRLAALD